MEDTAGPSQVSVIGRFRVRIAVISDVHSNLQALEEVKRRTDDEGIDYVLSAGDAVGYGANPNRCCAILSGWARNSVLGNHDVAALRRDPSGMNPYAAKAALWTAERIDEHSREYLESLKESAHSKPDGRAVEVRHGSLRSILEYVFEADLSEDLLMQSGAEVLVLGHTHVPYARRYASGLIVNPGSVGQPRDGDPRASFGILQTDPLSFEISRVDYDIDGASEAILNAGLPEFLAERLFRGF